MRTFIATLALAGQFAMAETAPSVSSSTPMQVTVSGGVLHGTLLTPGSKGPIPVVLLISGSGPTDRDGNTPVIPGSNNSLRLLAEALESNNIASLRYDKRGIGESAKAMTTEADLRFDIYVDDASRWCDQLRDDKRFSRVVIIGHSEGSLIGMLAARQCHASGFVSIAGAGHTAGDILRTQLAGKLPEDLAARSEAILRDLEEGKLVSDVPTSLFAIYRPSVQPYMISWLRHDPAKAAAELRVPLLVIQGGTDIQITIDDAKRLASANTRATLSIIEGMNHVLKTVAADQQKQLASYSDPSLPLASELIPAIVKFVRNGGK